MGIVVNASKRVGCFFTDHNWIIGKSAPKDARSMLKGWKVFHNRICSKCGKEDLAADRAELELERLYEIKERISDYETGGRVYDRLCGDEPPAPPGGNEVA